MVSKSKMSGQLSRHLSVSCPDNCQALLSVREAAQLAQVSERTIARKINAGIIHSQKSGHRRLVCQDSVLSIITKNLSPATDDVAPQIQDINVTLDNILELMTNMLSLYHPQSLDEINKKQQLREKIQSVQRVRHRSV